MSTIALSKDNFEQVVSENAMVIIDFWAEWCGPCKSFAPIFEKAAQAHTDIVFGKVDTDAQQELAGFFQIRSIPTLMVFRDKVLLFQNPGALPAQLLEELITQVRNVDMEDVRKKLAEQDKNGKAT